MYLFKIVINNRVLLFILFIKLWKSCMIKLKNVPFSCDFLFGHDRVAQPLGHFTLNNLLFLCYFFHLLICSFHLPTIFPYRFNQILLKHFSFFNLFSILKHKFSVSKIFIRTTHHTNVL